MGKVFLRIIVGVALSILIGAALMIFTYALPTERLVENVRDGLPLYEREGNYPSWALGEHSRLDNFTDAIILLEVTHPTENLIEAAMLNPRFVMPEEERPVETLIKVFGGDTSGLIETVYPRYWHGELVILKPLLIATQVQHVRMLFAYADFILFVVALMMFQKVLGTRYTLAFAAVIMTLNLVSVSMSFQFSTVYIVTMSAIIFMLKKNRRLFDDDLYNYFFAAIGIIIGFTDFFTYPAFSVGLPLIVYYLLNRRELLKKNLAHVLKLMTGLLISWGIGYAGMWSGKWIIAQVLTDYNALSDALGQVSSYMQINNALNTAGWQITSLGSIQRNIAVVGHGPIRIFIFAAIIFLVYMLIRRRKKISFSARKFLPYLMPAVLPFIWYAMASGHSHIHAFFTYRSLTVTIFALTCAAFEIFSEPDTLCGV
ncbi:MAG: hypothetical protein IJT57_03335 [Selenomonadaceae bacterium]|nr:hypothetical protein [Selenomonadaceae bacterium]